MAKWNGRLLALWLAGFLFWPVCVAVRSLLASGVPVGSSESAALSGFFFFVDRISPFVGCLVCVIAVALSNRTTGRKVLLGIGSLVAIVGLMAILFGLFILCGFLYVYCG